MENKYFSLVILSGTISLLPSDLKKDKQLINQVLNECLYLSGQSGQEGDALTTGYVIQPLVLDWLSSAEAVNLIEQCFMESLQENRTADDQGFQELYSVWVGSNRDLPAVLNKLQGNKRICVIPAAITNFPLTHLLTDWGIQLLIDQSIMLYNKHFTEPSKGFWLPLGAYSPGIDLYLTKAGIEYSFISETTFVFSEKDQETDLLRTPRGLRLVPAGFNPGRSRVLLAEGGHKEIGSEIGKYLEMGYVLSGYEEDSLLNENAAMTRAGFGYLGMEAGQRILPDEALIQIRELHKMERILKDISLNGTRHLRLYKQMVREWLYSLHCLTNEPLEFSSSLQAFRQLYDQFESNREDTAFVEYRENQGYLSLEALEFQADVSIKEATKQQTVLLLTWEYPPNIVGGLSRHVHDLSKSLVKKGCKVVVLTAEAEGAPAFEEDEGVDVYRVGPLHPMEEDFLQWVFQLNLAFIEMASGIFEKEDITLIHAHDWIVGKSAVLMKDHYNIPLVTTIHATENGRNQGIFTDLHQRIHEEEQKLVKASNQIIICSEHMKEELANLEAGRNLNVTVIPNGVNLRNVSSEDSGRIKDMLHDKKYYFSIGRIVEEKGFETIIETAQLLGQEASIHFVIAGKGPLLEQYRHQVKEKGLEEIVHFLGYVSDSERNSLLFQSQAVIFPSIYEPFGIVALEAMAARKAVIASKTGGLKALIKHGHAGLLFDPGSAEDLKASILLLEGSNQEKEQMGINGYKMAQMMFSWDRIAAQTLGVYEETAINHKVEGSLL